ncbi:BRO family protein [Microcoleus sp. T3_D1]|uniref:BRO family protein n=1 Tax=Microcoleus sp. T3_D1 TaxID=3055427 RepID=UPI002FD15BFC
MTTAISVFEFETLAIRIATLDGEPWFVAKDLCDVLDVANPSQALSRLEEDEKNTIILNEGNRGNPSISVISESGMYALVLSSRKPAAKSFRKWVTAEVLPAIRKTGTYSVPVATPAPVPQSSLDVLAQSLQALTQVAQSMAEVERRQREQEAILTQLVAGKEQAEAELAALPLSQELPADIPARGRTNMIVRNYAQRNSVSYSAIWSKLYLELYYRYKFDVKARCRRSGRKPLDQIEVDGMLEALYAIASEVLA